MTTDKRKAEAERIKQKYNDRIPVRSLPLRLFTPFSFLLVININVSPSTSSSFANLLCFGVLVLDCGDRSSVRKSRIRISRCWIRRSIWCQRYVPVLCCLRLSGVCNVVVVEKGMVWRPDVLRDEWDHATGGMPWLGHVVGKMMDRRVVATG